MSITTIEAWLQDFTGLDAETLGSGTVVRAARERMMLLRCASVEAYLAVLAESQEERHALIDRVVVPETWFFRDGAAFDALARHVTEEWGPAHPGAVFHVLSVPCSTGEEPYSLAIAFARAGWPLERLHIQSVDISRENLARAREGTYGRNSFRGDDLAFRDAYFETTAPGVWRLRDSVRAPVRFEFGNLLADDFASGRGLYDAIFCRNLLIYFDRRTQARAIRLLAAMLAPEGWIAVGPAEPVLLFEHDFEPVKIPAGFVLRRVREPLALAPSSASGKRSVAVAAVPSSQLRGEDRPRAKMSLKESLPAPAPETIEEIRALADAGRLREAGERGRALLAGAGPSAELLYLLGVVAEADDDTRRAEEYYRKAVYLEPRHAEALSHLALLAEKNGDGRAARQFRQRAAGAGGSAHSPR